MGNYLPRKLAGESHQTFLLTYWGIKNDQRMAWRTNLWLRSKGNEQQQKEISLSDTYYVLFSYYWAHFSFLVLSILQFLYTYNLIFLPLLAFFSQHITGKNKKVFICIIHDPDSLCTYLRFLQFFPCTYWKAFYSLVQKESHYRVSFITSYAFFS